MMITLRRWRSDRRYRATLGALTRLNRCQLAELGIRPYEVDRLAREIARAA